MVTVHNAVSSVSIVHTGVLLNAYHILEIYRGEDMYTGIGHLLAPEELTERGTGAPQDNLIIRDTVLGQNIQYTFSFF